MSQGIQPPLSQDLTATLGPQLLGYVRSLDAPGSEQVASSSSSLDNAIQCLHTLIGVSTRQGILQNDIKMAESLLMATAVSTSQQQQTSQKNKKRQTSTTEDNHDSGTTLSTTLPVQLVMTAILRIFSLQPEENTTSVEAVADHALLTTLAADLVRAVVHHARHNSGNSPAICVQAVYEWLQNSVKSLFI